ncbi:MAG: indole-3-glycerol phosphate synthase TrpC [Chloroflexi bacterium]|nr:MAG: indole-3-glycerol phosphate synthase TrpC [Phototrophicales bacterium]RMF77542.1 MAG: indole-3-glycerol phosphate synthase TrpC [Chloroflexota bacterium]
MRTSFVKTDTVLDKILAHKVDEVVQAKATISQSVLESAIGDTSLPRDFIAALRRDTVALIAEVKHASPSKGVLIKDFDPVALGTTYAASGAAAISVLTDERFFQGHLDFLANVRQAVDVPVLRKEFIIDPYQVYEGRAAGADAILLIVAALTDTQLHDLYAIINELGMAALVEVHNEAEMERALKLEAKLIGINNRDLKTFDVDIEITRQLAKLAPDDVTLVAESGLLNADAVRQMGEVGAHAVLVGEGLVKADDVAAQVRVFSSQPRAI